MGIAHLSSELKEKVRLVAATKGLTLSGIYRSALAEYCERELAPMKASRYDDIIGVGDGPPDLSARSEEIFGRSWTRCTAADTSTDAGPPVAAS